MTHSHDPAFPCNMPVILEDSPHGLRYRDGVQPREGLTKLEYFAALMLQGLIGNGKSEIQVNGLTLAIDAAAVTLAEALIAELNRRVA